MQLKMALFLVHFHVCVVHVCICTFALCEGTRAWGCTYVHIHGEAQVELGIILYHIPPCFIEAVSQSDPELINILYQ